MGAVLSSDVCKESLKNLVRSYSKLGPPWRTALKSPWGSVRHARAATRGYGASPRAQSDYTLIETMIAVTILVIVAVGVVPVITQGFQSAAEQQGNLATRTSEYAQDKMESLINLNFNDGATDTTVFPPAVSGGTGLGGTLAASSTAGSVPPAAVGEKYVDYLVANGNLLATFLGGILHPPRWSIATDSTAALKTITVVIKAALQAAGVSWVWLPPQHWFALSPAD